MKHHETTFVDSWSRNDLRLNTLPNKLPACCWWVVSLGVAVTKSRSDEYLDQKSSKWTWR